MLRAHMDVGIKHGAPRHHHLAEFLSYHIQRLLLLAVAFLLFVREENPLFHPTSVQTGKRNAEKPKRGSSVP